VNKNTYKVSIDSYRPFVVARSEPMNDCNLVFTCRQLSADGMIYREGKPL